MTTTTYGPAVQKIMHPENERAGRITVEAFMVHTVVDAVGHTDLASYLDREDVGPRVHFYNPRSGPLEQLLDLDRRAAAGGIADAWAIMMECEDDSAGRKPDDFLPLTNSQLRNIIELGIWMAEPGRFPRFRNKVITSARYYPGRAGLCYHSMPMKRKLDGTSYNPYTKYQGKECPTNPRIRQLETICWPAIIAGTAGSTTKPQEELTMAQFDELKAMLNALSTKVDTAVMAMSGSQFVPGKLNETDVLDLGDIDKKITDLHEAMKLNNLALVVNLIRELEERKLLTVKEDLSDQDLADLAVVVAQEDGR